MKLKSIVTSSLSGLLFLNFPVLAGRLINKNNKINSAFTIKVIKVKPSPVNRVEKTPSLDDLPEINIKKNVVNKPSYFPFRIKIPPPRPIRKPSYMYMGFDSYPKGETVSRFLPRPPFKQHENDINSMNYDEVPEFERISDWKIFEQAFSNGNTLLNSMYLYNSSYSYRIFIKHNVSILSEFLYRACKVLKRKDLISRLYDAEKLLILDNVEICYNTGELIDNTKLRICFSYLYDVLYEIKDAFTPELKGFELCLKNSWWDDFCTTLSLSGLADASSVHIEKDDYFLQPTPSNLPKWYLRDEEYEQKCFAKLKTIKKNKVDKIRPIEE